MATLRDATTAAEHLAASDAAAHRAFLRRVMSQPNPQPNPQPAATLEPWLAEELRRGSHHLDGFSWRTDPPTDEGFRV